MKKNTMLVTDKQGVQITTLRQLLKLFLSEKSEDDMDRLMSMYSDTEIISLIAGNCKLLLYELNKTKKANKRLTSKLNALLQGNLFQEGDYLL